MAKLVYDSMTFAKLVKVIKDKKDISQVVEKVKEIVVYEDFAELILKAARSSIGNEMLEADLKSIEDLADKVIHLVEYRQELREYLQKSMKKVAPNLQYLMGDIGARLIAKAGSLESLAKMPASTVQLLGAEKALFRALRFREPTPKHGIIFHSPFLQMSRAQDKGKVARTLSNKISIAARVDSFGDEKTDIFGRKLSDQMRERLQFINSGVKPKTNIAGMREANKEYENEKNENYKKRQKLESEEKQPSHFFDIPMNL